MLSSAAYYAQYEAYNRAFFLVLPTASAACDTLRLLAKEANDNYLIALRAECLGTPAEPALPTLTDEDAAKYQVVGEVFHLSAVAE